MRTRLSLRMSASCSANGDALGSAIFLTASGPMFSAAPPNRYCTSNAKQFLAQPTYLFGTAYTAVSWRGVPTTAWHRIHRLAVRNWAPRIPTICYA